MAGIYIHIPFCKQKCSYCDFHFSTVYEKYRDNMLLAMAEEMKIRADYLKNETIETIYFGGGTPSLLTAEELEKLVTTAKQYYAIDDTIEFTLEANPDDIHPATLQSWKDLGINRLSIGVQSFLQADLDWMNRAHTAEESFKAVQMALEFGFHLTVDLIYGLPYRKVKDWEDNIEKLVELSPQHISAYCLTVEKGTALYKMMEKGELPQVAEEEQAQQFLTLINSLKKAGYEQYEISNFAKNQCYSKHNSNYWKGINYIGIGPSAHSFDGKTRQWNCANNPQYIKKINGSAPFFEKEELSPVDQFNELLLTGLRTKWGVDLATLAKIQTIPAAFYAQVKAFEKHQLLRWDEQRLILTDEGKLQADFITSELFLFKK